MKNIGVALVIVASASVGCGDGGNSGPNQAVSFDLNSLAGIYQDTLPEANALGNVVQLTINSDSTFSLIERTYALDQKIIVPRNTAGKIQIEENGAKLKLVPRNQGAKPWWLGQKEGKITVLDSTGHVHTNSSAYNLDRISTAVTRIGRDQLFSVVKGSVRFPLNVYSRPGGSNLSLSTFYLTSCSEAELGLVHRYISAFKGKLENQDPLALVLNRDSKGLTELSNRSISAVEGLSASAEVQQHTLSSLVINKSPDRWTVTYSFLDANDENWMGKDSYQLNNGIFQLIEKGLVEKL